MMTLERRRDLITVLKPYFLPKRLHSTKSDLQAFSRVLPTSRVGYHAGKPIESVVYCLSMESQTSAVFVDQTCLM